MGDGLDISFAAAFVAGLISFVSPCVLPIVPPYLAFLAGTSFQEMTDENPSLEVRWRIIRSAILFVAGFATVFVALGATATSIGRLVSEHLDTLSVIAGMVIFAMGVHFTGLVRIPLLYREARVHLERKPAGPLGSYLVGLAFAFGWTPCVGPVLAAVLFKAGAEENVSEGAMLLASYAAGIGVPFILAAAFAGLFLGAIARFRPWMGVVEKIMGVLLMLTGVAFMTGMMPRFATWMLETFPSLGTFG